MIGASSKHERRPVMMHSADVCTPLEVRAESFDAAAFVDDVVQRHILVRSDVVPVDVDIATSFGKVHRTASMPGEKEIIRMGSILTTDVHTLVSLEPTNNVHVVSL